MASKGPDITTLLRMVPLARAGRKALEAHLANLPAKKRPVVPEFFDVVTEADFLANTMTCLRQAVFNERPVHILCANGSICALLERVSGK